MNIVYIFEISTREFNLLPVFSLKRMYQFRKKERKKEINPLLINY